MIWLGFDDIKRFTVRQKFKNIEIRTINLSNRSTSALVALTCNQFRRPASKDSFGLSPNAFKVDSTNSTTSQSEIFFKTEIEVDIFHKFSPSYHTILNSPIAF